MKLKLSSIADKGDFQKERVVIRAIDSTGVGEFVLLCTGVNDDGGLNIGVVNTYWFPDKEVRAGDLVVVYSKTGTNSEKALDNGTNKAHFFYWGLSREVWSSSRVAPVLLHAPIWETLTKP